MKTKENAEPQTDANGHESEEGPGKAKDGGRVVPDPVHGLSRWLTAARCGLLVSVRDAAEAEEAVAGGADVVDVKEPANGPLGCADADTIAAVVATVAGRRPVTVALGELHERNWRRPELRGVIEAAGLAAVKVGFGRPPDIAVGGYAGERRQIMAASESYRQARAEIAGAAVVPVHYVGDRIGGSGGLSLEQAWDALVLGSGGFRHEFPAVVFDTRDKGRPDLLHCQSPRVLASAVNNVRETTGAVVCLAGSLRLATLERSIRRLAPHEPDVIGVRGAACDRDDRAGRVRAELVAALSQRLAELGRVAGRI